MGKLLAFFILPCEMLTHVCGQSGQFILELVRKSKDNRGLLALGTEDNMLEFPSCHTKQLVQTIT